MCNVIGLSPILSQPRLPHTTFLQSPGYTVEINTPSDVLRKEPLNGAISNIRQRIQN